jgi:hypothetical protein
MQEMEQVGLRIIVGLVEIILHFFSFLEVSPKCKNKVYQIFCNLSHNYVKMKTAAKFCCSTYYEEGVIITRPHWN